MRKKRKGEAECFSREYREINVIEGRIRARCVVLFAALARF